MIFTATEPSLFVYGCGSSKDGELGVTSTTPILQHLDLRGVFGHTDNIRQIACGGQFTYVLTNDNRVFCSGLSNLGQCGSYVNRPKFEELSLSSTILSGPIIHMACGEYFVSIVTDDMRLFLCGVKFNGRTTSQFEEYPIPLDGRTDKITKICCSAFHILLVVNDVDVYSLGCNAWGNLGRNTSGEDELTFGKVQINDWQGNCKVKTIGCGGIHSLIHFESGELYTCANSYLEPKKTIAFERVKLPFSDPVRDLTLSPLGTHMMLRTEKDLWVSGSNKSGQLLTGDCKQVNGIQKCNIESIVGNDEYRLFLARGRTFMATRDNLYCVGENRYGQLGLLDNITNYKVRRVPIDFSDKELVDVEGGYDFTFFVCRRTNCYGFMSNLHRCLSHSGFVDIEVKTEE